MVRMKAYMAFTIGEILVIAPHDVDNIAYLSY